MAGEKMMETTLKTLFSTQMRYFLYCMQCMYIFRFFNVVVVVFSFFSRGEREQQIIDITIGKNVWENMCVTQNSCVMTRVTRGRGNMHLREHLGEEGCPVRLHLGPRPMVLPGKLLQKKCNWLSAIGSE